MNHDRFADNSNLAARSALLAMAAAKILIFSSGGNLTVEPLIWGTSGLLSTTLCHMAIKL